MNAEINRRVRLAARGLARAGLVGAYGHCSERVDAHHFIVNASMPMGTIGLGEPGTKIEIDGPLPEGVLGEVRIHQRIYARRNDVGAVCRVFPPTVVALSTQLITPRARHGVGAFFAPCPPLWTDIRLLRDDERADQVASLLGQGNTVVLRGNGAVCAASTLEVATMFAVFLEEAARIEAFVRHCGCDPSGGVLNEEEVALRASLDGSVTARMWRFLTFGDPET
jgi:HCOMODA/2-hydroxy-3-carboxy-muconic semialdehyde decarboxylase